MWLHERLLKWWYDWTSKGDRRGWIICAATICVTCTRQGPMFSFGSSIVNLGEEFPTTPMAVLAFIGAVPFALSNLLTPLSVAILRSVGYDCYRTLGYCGTAMWAISALLSSVVPSPGWLFVTYCPLTGFGSNVMFAASSLAVGEHFPREHRHHVMATSCIYAGYPLGSLMFNGLNAWIIDQTDFRVAFQVDAVISLIAGLVCSWTFTRHHTAEAEMDNHVAKNADNKSASAAGDTTDNGENVGCRKKMKACWSTITHRPEIILWLIGASICAFDFHVPTLLLESYATERGSSMTQGSLLMSLLSLSQLIVYIIASTFGDRLKNRLIYASILSAVSRVVLFFVWPLIDCNFAIILILCIAMGIFIGLSIIYVYATSLEVTQLSADTAWSATQVASGIGITCGPMLSGLVYDLSGTFDAVFWVIGFVNIIMSLTFGAIPVIQRLRERSTSSAATEEHETGQETDLVLEQSNTDDSGVTHFGTFKSISDN